ncbi:hypothetical protein FB562_1891 [Homoserinimonas aerilata]|uniref:Uncharacterized protein n=1 Tax=Homoserinimonas aerilata TaxID=1162970 RepID=A0A542YL18_9MICO|nr:hypothetical protein [Homoserinimonas aerilata]TQL48785.1 hypothetical protein FB562_1891 [Homoserinimonas aerilata]
MGLFTPKKAQPETGTEQDGLPPGFEDQDSPFFIPEPLREHYVTSRAEAARYPADIENYVKSVARRRAEAEYDTAYPREERPADTNLADVAAGLTRIQQGLLLAHHRDATVSARADAIVRDERATLVELMFHETALGIALRAHDTAELARRADAAHQRRTTCPVCGQCDPARNGPIEKRSLLPGLPNQVFMGRPEDPRTALQLRSCVPCHAVAVDEYLETLASETGPDFKHPTRRAAVRAALTLDGQPFTAE